MSTVPESSSLAVTAHDVGKCYHIYDQPQDRLKQALFRRRRQYFREFWALRDVSFELRKGEALGIVGRNGSGKSTLLQIIAGTLRPSTGEIHVTGRVAALLELGSGFNPEFTGRENAYMNGSILGLSHDEMDARFDDIAAFADIGEFLEQPVKTYSSGMLVRLAFAVQVQLRPDILIVDEALSVGDQLFQKRCFQKLDELRNSGVSLLFVSHDQESVRTLTNQAIMLHEGHIRSIGAPAEVVLDYRRLLHDDEKRYLERQMQHARDQQQKAAGSVTPATSPKTQAADRLSFGDFDAEVVETRVFNALGEETSVFYPGDKLIIRVTCVLKRDLEHLAVAVRLRNKQGVKIYSWGTLNQDHRIWSGLATGEALWDKSLVAGTTIAVDFECDCHLGLGFYEVQSTITEAPTRQFPDQRIIHWRDEAAFFQVLLRSDENFFGGICDMRMAARTQTVEPNGVHA